MRYETLHETLYRCYKVISLIHVIWNNAKRNMSWKNSNGMKQCKKANICWNISSALSFYLLQKCIIDRVIKKTKMIVLILKNGACSICIFSKEQYFLILLKCSLSLTCPRIYIMYYKYIHTNLSIAFKVSFEISNIGSGKYLNVLFSCNVVELSITTTSFVKLRGIFDIPVLHIILESCTLKLSKMLK